MLGEGGAVVGVEFLGGCEEGRRGFGLGSSSGWGKMARVGAGGFSSAEKGKGRREALQV